MKRSRTSSRHRALAVALVVFRALAFLVAVQCSGAVHFVVDAAEVMDGSPHMADDCSGDDDDCPAGCPPGCPTCHCSAGALASLPPKADCASTIIHLVSGHERRLPGEERLPASAERTSLFRPPRTVVLEA